MKFRPKRKKGERFRRPIPVDVDDASDVEFDAPEHRRSFGQTRPLTPPESLEDYRRRKFQNTRDVLRLNLHHGDILIQQGPGLQKLYEVAFSFTDLMGKHAAVPLGMRIVATARYINTEIHGGNNSTTTDVAIGLTAGNPVADEIVVETIPIISKNSTPIADEPRMSEMIPPGPFVPYPPPLSFHPPPILNPPPQLTGTQIPYIYSHYQAPYQSQSHGDASATLQWSDRFVWANWIGGTVGVFPASNVREKRPPVILPSDTIKREGWTWGRFWRN